MSAPVRFSPIRKLRAGCQLRYSGVYVVTTCLNATSYTETPYSDDACTQQHGDAVTVYLSNGCVPNGGPEISTFFNGTCVSGDFRGIPSGTGHFSQFEGVNCGVNPPSTPFNVVSFMPPSGVCVDGIDGSVTVACNMSGLAISIFAGKGCNGAPLANQSARLPIGCAAEGGSSMLVGCTAPA